ncbi:MAG TPA: 23S rRNA (uracil(1939)-C(5))-methyltransferase RlmD [Burkholderiales bacterium]|nr:23S rRNA (uracil(1939)-C(5))-methyltransferase RlmD [Burkholderiales bacterium]
MPRALIESLDREGRGVAHVEGKTVFIDGAVTGEEVEYASYRKKPAWEAAQVLRTLKQGPSRAAPRCAFFGTCGGCSMQHVDVSTQVAAKQRVLEDALWHIGRVRPEAMLRPLHGLPWGYRHRARLSARWVEKKGGSLVGFRERKSTYVTDMTSCEVLPLGVSALIRPLRALIDVLDIKTRIPQIEVAVGDELTVLVLRVLDAVGPADAERLRRFADEHSVQLWLQPEGPDSARPFWPPQAPELRYALPQYGVHIAFGPTDFTQVNHAVNRLLVSRALALLDPRPGERITDFFCGLGNFTLPIATSGAQVLGVEGSAGLLARAQANAQANSLAERCRFALVNLFQAEECARLPACDKALLDPPREGAIELVRSFEAKPPLRIVYVACDPATLARDSGVLANALGYRLAAAGVVNMFPHTSHVESIALFERQ